MSIPSRNIVHQVAEAPVIQYSSGHSKARTLGTTNPFLAFIGFYSEQGKDGAFDEACAAAGLAQIEIRHQRQGGSEVKRHWSFGETLAIYPLTSGPVAATVAASLANGNRRRTAEAGLGARWGEGERSKFALRGVLRLAAGYTGIVQLATRSKMTDRLLGALVAHTQVAEQADGLVNRERHPEPVGPWELLLTLGVGAEESWGKGDTASVAPLQAIIPDEITVGYIRTIYLASEAVRQALGAAWHETVIWAEAYAAGQTEEPGEE
jgi:hypothetical protein